MRAAASKPLHDQHGLRAWTGKLGPMARAHRHHELEINYVLRGMVTYLIGGSVVTLPPRRLCVLWGAVPHQTIEREPQSVEAIWVTVPLAQVLAWDLPGVLVQRLLRTGCVIENIEQPADAPLFSQWIDDLKDAKASNPRAMLLELEARLCRLATRLARTAEPARDLRAVSAGRIPTPVEQLASFLASHYGEPVTISDAARSAHIHAHYAMTLFRRHTGLTLHQYLTVQRVAHAQRLLATTRVPIIDLALESGFASVSRFYAAFKAQTGTSPRHFRLRLSRAAGRRTHTRDVAS